MVDAARIAGRVLLARADAGPQIGYGHVARLESLLDAWTERGGRAILRGAGIGGAIRARLVDAGVEIIDIARPALPVGTAPEDAVSASAEDLTATIALAQSCNAIAAVIDGYSFGAEYRAGLSAALPTLAIDDLAAFECKADVVLNQNMGFDASLYRTAPETTLLVGHEYVVLRREFRRASETAPRGWRRARILVTFGGSDPANLTAPVVEALAPALAPEDTMVVIAGGAMRPEARARLSALTAIEDGARVEILTDVRHMADVISGSTLAVVAAGSTVWELLVCGVPPLAVPVAENQIAVARGVADRDVGIDLGATDGPKVRDAVLDLLADPTRRKEMAARGRALIDGRGVWRALGALLDAVDRRQT